MSGVGTAAILRLSCTTILLTLGACATPHVARNDNPRASLLTLDTHLDTSDAVRLHSASKLIAFKSVENSYPLGDDLSLLAEFTAAGLRSQGRSIARTISSQTRRPISRAGTD